MRCLASMLLTVTLLGAMAAPTEAAPFGWKNGTSRQFSFTSTASGYEFQIDGFAAFDYATLADCCTTALAPVIVAHPDASLKFHSLEVNTLTMPTEFRDGLDLAYLRSAIGPFNDVVGFVELSWPDYQAQVMSISFTIDESSDEPSDGNSVPEPVTLALVGAGLLGLGAWHRRRR